MGTSPSISKEQLITYDCHQIAEEVTSLGTAYLIYKDCILSNAVAGHVLAGFCDVDEFKEFLEDLGISDKIHKRILSSYFKVIFLTPSTNISSAASITAATANTTTAGTTIATEDNTTATAAVNPFGGAPFAHFTPAPSVFGGLPAAAPRPFTAGPFAAFSTSPSPSYYSSNPFLATPTETTGGFNLGKRDAPTQGRRILKIVRPVKK